MTDQHIIDQCSADYDSYCTYRADLVSGEQKVSDGLDKAVLTISSAALGLIFTIFDRLYTGSDVTSLANFRWSWVLLCGSVLFVLLSLLLSGHLYHRNLIQVDRILSNRAEIIDALLNSTHAAPNKQTFESSRFTDSFVRISHYAGSVFLFLGLLNFGIFVDKNLDGYRKIEEKNEQVQTSINCYAGRETKISSPTATTSSLPSATEEIINEPSHERREKGSSSTSPKTNKACEERIEK